MIPIPSPLHPAIVHFPIVLILFGTAVALAATFFRHWLLPLSAAVLLAAGAAGALAAAWTGGQEQEIAGELSPKAEVILEQHEEWGQRTRNIVILAAVFAAGAVVAARFPKLSRGFSIATALAAVSASICVAQTGHYGGQLVYKHGIGINTATGNTSELTQNTHPAAKDEGREND